MRRVSIAAGLTLFGGAVLTGCTMDTVIWGADGAEVIAETERLIAAAGEGDAEPFVCDGAEPELREAADWQGLSAEEPGTFVEEHWPEQVAFDPDWTINLSLPEERVAAGEQFPGDIFYRATDEGLCLVAVAWSTVLG